MATVTKAKRPQVEPLPAPIVLRLEGSYVVARCGEAFSVFQLYWEHPHGDMKQRLVLREVEIPRQFEAEAYPARVNGKAR